MFLRDNTVIIWYISNYNVAMEKIIMKRENNKKK